MSFSIIFLFFYHVQPTNLEEKVNLDTNSNSVDGKNEEIYDIDEGDFLAQSEQSPANESTQSRG